MFCKACKDIFLQPRAIGYGHYYPWAQHSTSFTAALHAGCHLCSLICEQSKYPGAALNRKSFSKVSYAFRILNEEWARDGRGHKWMQPQVVTENNYDHEDDELERRQTARLLTDSYDAQIGRINLMLTTDARELLDSDADIWLMLEFIGSEMSIALPFEIYRDGSLDDVMQTNLNLQTSTGSDQTLLLAQKWLHLCKENHPECRPVYDEINYVPTRLVCVGTEACPDVRLVLGVDLPPATPYLALSHCWGGKSASSLTKSALPTFLQQIPPEALSNTMREAITATRKIGLEYLWIDSLCIIQQDEQDWHVESAKMSQVYGFAACTIAAVCSENGEQGLFRNRDQYRVRPLKIANPFSKTPSLYFQITSQYLGPIYQKDVRETAWHNRSWVFQERLLSQRMLYFGSNQILWACQKLQASESCPRGKTSEFYIDRFESFEVEKARLRKMLEHKARSWSTRDACPWPLIVSEYTRANLSKPADRLVALQGIADRIGEALNDVYLDGLWSNETLPGCLLWHLQPKTISKRPCEYRCPSWSWGSVDGVVEFNEDLDKLHYYDVHKFEPGASSRAAMDSVGQNTKLKVTAPSYMILLKIDVSNASFILHRDKGPLHGMEYEESHEQPWWLETKSQATSINGGEQDTRLRQRLYRSYRRRFPEKVEQTNQIDEPEIPRTYSIADGTAYLYGLTRAQRRRYMEILGPRQPRFVSMKNATCLLDTTSHSSGDYWVRCLVLAQTRHNGSTAYGIIVHPSQTLTHREGASWVEVDGIPCYHRVGFFSCSAKDLPIAPNDDAVKKLLLM